MMEKTLYVTDMDGTLLNKQGRLSEYSKAAIRRFAEDNILFTCATGRTLTSVNALLGDTAFTCPAILSDGLFIYNMLDSAVIYTNPLSNESINNIESILIKSKSDGFLYALQDAQYSLFYKSLKHPLAYHFHQQKLRFLQNNTFQIPSFAHLPASYIPLYFVIYGPYSQLVKLRNDFEALPGIHCLLNRDVYHPQKDIFFMNVLNADCSKASAIHHLKKLVNASEVVAFGDNLNDIPMLMAADRCYVTENGIPQAKEIATGVIGSCDEDAVVRFIEREIMVNGPQ
ncbi:HAD-IIB family hydrolase [Sodalis ligni]|uniref:HAD-IIB family hydrolase n=1 Tax=Sodalis ligni TaxID=2697027 RepID=UPI001BDEF96B|nr:HAD-IIB family hydrolase [Sodalis ligni]QWA10845.1 HAD-IIB family hydrolase [Sodalis ligni]